MWYLSTMDYYPKSYLKDMMKFDGIKKFPDELAWTQTNVESFNIHMSGLMENTNLGILKVGGWIRGTSGNHGKGAI